MSAKRRFVLQRQTFVEAKWRPLKKPSKSCFSCVFICCLLGRAFGFPIAVAGKLSFHLLAYDAKKFKTDVITASPLDVIVLPCALFIGIVEGWLVLRPTKTQLLSRKMQNWESESANLDETIWMLFVWCSWGFVLVVWVVPQMDNNFADLFFCVNVRFEGSPASTAMWCLN